MKKLLLGASMALMISMPLQAQELSFSSDDVKEHKHHIHHNHHNHAHHNHSEHLLTSPAGIMGDHLHRKGEWMISYRYMQMFMEDMRDGTDNLSPVEIAANVSNPFGPGGNTRVVPTEMTMDMHMLMAMYGVTDWLTLMVMGNYTYKEMDHVTFSGGAGTTELGTFTTATSGFGDTTVGGIFDLYKDDTHQILATAGLSLPTGSITEEDDVLAPTGARPRLRLPYAMRLGSGTYDLMPQLTYTGREDQMAWGAQYTGTIRIGENDENYTLGDKHVLNLWGAYKWRADTASSMRVTFETEDSIDGQDALIAAPVTTADPDNYGGERIVMSLGTNYEFTDGHIMNLEASIPVYQDLNGPQLERDYAFTIGWQTTF